MGYSKDGNRPFELASKSSHSHIINDPDVQAFLDTVELPSNSEDIDITTCAGVFHDSRENPIKYYIAVDGGYTTSIVKKKFPSAEIAFCQYGANIFSRDDLESLSPMPFLGPEDIAKLKEIQRHKVVLPIKNLLVKEQKSLKDSLRTTIFQHFTIEDEGESLADTLQWFLFEEYQEQPKDEYQLASCPVCGATRISIQRNAFDKHQTFCAQCNGKIYLTDMFRFHEIVDEELGATGFLGYFINLVEHFTIIHLIRLILKRRAKLLDQILFIKDGPLAFFGQTANMHKKMRSLTKFLLKKHNLYLVGVEKSGIFVEHANEIANILPSDQILLLENDYIYRHIIRGFPDPNAPYASTSYYGGKFIYKSDNDQLYVATVPIESADVILSPEKSDYANIDIVISNLKKLSCSMYDNSLVPIALVNKLVSLSMHPSKVILERFARDRIIN